MEILQETRLVEQTITRYKASDGRVFDDPRFCADYERLCTKAKLKVIEQCEEANGSPNFDGSEYPDHHGYTWYRPKNQEEIDLLNAAYGNFDYGMLSEKHIGTWVCVEDGDDYAFVSALEDGIAYAKEVLRRLGYSMTVTPNTAVGGDAS